MKKLSMICAILLLSACGSGTSSYEFPVPPAPPAPPVVPAPPAPPPVAAIDKFYALVLSFFATPEDSESTILDDSMVATQPEDTEPVEFT